MKPAKNPWRRNERRLMEQEPKIEWPKINSHLKAFDRIALAIFDGYTNKKAIAEYLELSRWAVSYRVGKLEQAGLVKRFDNTLELTQTLENWCEWHTDYFKRQGLTGGFVWLECEVFRLAAKEAQSAK